MKKIDLACKVVTMDASSVDWEFVEIVMMHRPHAVFLFSENKPEKIVMLQDFLAFSELKDVKRERYEVEVEDGIWDTGLRLVDIPSIGFAVIFPFVDDCGLLSGPTVHLDGTEKEILKKQVFWLLPEYQNS